MEQNAALPLLAPSLSPIPRYKEVAGGDRSAQRLSESWSGGFFPLLLFVKMGTSGPRLPVALVLVAAVLACRWHHVAGDSETDLPAAAAPCMRVPVIFNFGDSNSDTGGISAGLGFYFGPPSGRVFFRRPTGRLCDGRLVIDFLCESVNSSYLSPYLESLGSNFANGANFAIAGAATLPRMVAFSLSVQVNEFTHFRSRSLQLIAQGTRGQIDQQGFSSALYTFDIGQNDLTAVFKNNLSYPEILQRIPVFLAEIKSAIQIIYGLGGRNFWVHNTGPLGCLPEKLAAFNKDGKDLDPAGCLSTINTAAKAFNSGLDSLCDELRSQLTGATIVYTDVYSIKYDIVANYTRYGFQSATMACCGYGGPPYNYNTSVNCLAPGFTVCPEGARYVSWDGVHYTEAANTIVASRILSGAYSKPAIPFQRFCTSG